MENKLNIVQRMLAIQTELGTVAKNLNVVTNAKTNKGYKAVSERDVKDAVKPLEDKHGVYSYAVSSEIVDSGVLTSMTDSGYERKSQYMWIKETYRFVNVDKPDEFIEVSAFGDGIDTGDKAPGKADTYAGKYALMKAYKISTGDDPDQEASPEKGYNTAKMTGKATEKQISLIEDLYTDDEINKILANYKINSLEELDKGIASKYISNRAKGKAQ